jgi:uncharacterized alpha-E superfamily protein
LSSLLARFAENLFWMARYMERAENLARILDVNESFARDSNGAQDWGPMVQLHNDDAAFAKQYRQATSDSVVNYYVIDRKNPNSIAYSVWAARENARSLRHLISIEVWSQLNVFYEFVRGLKPRDLRLAALSPLCQVIKEGCQLHTGIIEGTTYRDQGWTFYQLGKLIERADQTTRLLDIKYHRLLPQASDIGSAIDVSQWNALLRSAAAYHGYRRVHPSAMTPATVAGFILLRREFPRSVNACTRAIRNRLDELAHDPDLAGVRLDLGPLQDLEGLVSVTIKEAIDQGLHEHLDKIQIALHSLANALATVYFDADEALQAQSQSQSQAMG